MKVLTLMQFFSPPRLHTFTRTLMALGLVLALSFSVIAQQVRSGATMRVITHDEAEQAVAAVVVELKRNGTVVSKTTTDEKGIAEFTNIAPGTYEVVTSKEGLETRNQPYVAVTAGTPDEI